MAAEETRTPESQGIKPAPRPGQRRPAGGQPRPAPAQKGAPGRPAAAPRKAPRQAPPASAPPEETSEKAAAASADGKPKKKTDEQKIQDIRASMVEFLEIWKETKGMLLKAFMAKEPISDAEEEKFLTQKTQLIRMGKRLDMQTPSYLEVGNDQINKIMKAAVNLKILSEMNTIAKKGLYSNWHIAYLQMHRTIGALDVFADGYRPKREVKKRSSFEKAAQSMSGMFGHRISASGETAEESPVKTIIMIVTGLALTALLIWAALNIG